MSEGIIRKKRPVGIRRPLLYPAELLALLFRHLSRIYITESDGYFNFIPKFTKATFGT